MTRNFIIAIFLGVAALSLFGYFIFSVDTGKKPVTNTLSTEKGATAQTLKVEDTQVGTGAAVKSGDTVVMHYTGKLPDGTKFDSSLDRDEPFETQIGAGQVIKGWDEGILGMKVGGKRKLIIPPDMGYGDQQNGTIPPNSTLIFDVELLEIK